MTPASSDGVAYDGPIRVDPVVVLTTLEPSMQDAPSLRSTLRFAAPSSCQRKATGIAFVAMAQSRS